MTAADIWNKAENILCVRLDSIGDVLMTTPAIRALKESRPGRRITLFTSPAGVEVASLVPEIDDVIVYDAPWMKATAPRPNSQPEFEMVEKLRSLQFDAAVIFTVFSQNPLLSAFLCYLADIPLRLAHCHENPYQLLTNWVLDPEPSCGIRHEVRRQLDLVATVGCRTTKERMSLRVPEDAHHRILQILAKLGIDLKRPLVVIHPGATATSRRYPPEGFAQVARRLILDANFQVIFTGSESEREKDESKEWGGGVLSIEVKSAPDEIHQVERNLRLIESVGFQICDRSLSIQIPESARYSVTAKLSDQGLMADAPYLLLNPWTSCQARTYNWERFAVAARQLAEITGWPVVVTGVENDRDRSRPLLEALEPYAIDLIGATNLPELAALIAGARLVLTNNTSTMHLADAKRTPSVILFAGTDYESQWKPRHSLSRLLRQPTSCSPCYAFSCPYNLECLDISPETVVAAGLELLQINSQVSLERV